MADNRDRRDRLEGFGRDEHNVPLDWLHTRLEPGSEEWLAAVEHLGVQPQPGDEIWRFGSPAHFWKALAGRAGEALVRDGQVRHSVLLFRN